MFVKLCKNILQNICFSYGFTLLELIIVIAISVILISITTGAYFGAHRKAVLNTTAEQIQQVLRLARQKSLSQEEGLGWGVHFENPSSGGGTPWYALYKGSPYNSANITAYYYLPSQVSFFVPGSGTSLNVEFSKLTGSTVNNNIIIQLNPEGTQKTISVLSTGAIEIQ